MRIIIFTLLLCSITPALSQESCYVSPSGDDIYPGTAAFPWRTIQKACNSANPNSIVYVKAGVYNEKLILNVSGSSSGGYITFRNFANDTVIIDGSGKVGDQMILIQNKSYIKIIGFELRNNLNQLFGTGIWIKGYGDHIEIRNNRIHDMKADIGGGDAMGISIYGSHASPPISNIIIDGNSIYNCQPGHSESLTLNGNIDTFQVSNNIVHDNNNIGIDMIGGEGTCPTPLLDVARNGTCFGNTVYNCRSNYGGGYAAGIYVDGGKNIVVERNISRQNDIGLEIGCENNGTTASGIIVRDNLIYNNDKGGLSFGGYNYPTTGQVTTSSFTNNTCFRNDTLGTGRGELTIEYALNCTVKNNIFMSNSFNRLMTTTIGNSSDNILDYNLWFTPGGTSNASVDYNGTVYNTYTDYKNGTGQDTHSLFASPFFISPSLPTPDLHLQSGSSAIDAGNPAFAPASGETDFDETARVKGIHVDMGAIEQTINAPGAPNAPQNLIVTAGNAQVTLRWNRNTESDFLHYRIYGGTSLHPATLIDSTLSIIDTTKTISGLTNNVQYFFRLTATDNDLNESSYSNELTIAPFDPTLPTVPQLVGEGGIANTPTLRWKSSQGALTYLLQVSSDIAFTTISFDDSTITDTLRQTNMFMDSTVYYWRVNAKNLAGTSGWSNVWSFSTTNGNNTIHVNNQWNLISLPGDVIDPRRTTLFPSAASNAFAFNGSYILADSLINGKGYWLKFNGSQNVFMSGTAISTDTIPVVDGWNLIGSISAPVAITSIGSVPSGVITSNFFGYAGNYSVTDSLQPGKGYWVKVNQNALLILTSNINIPSSQRINIIPTSELPPSPPEEESTGGVISHRPERFELLQNYPNPFNPTTQLQFAISKLELVTLKVYDILGREIVTLVNEELLPGIYRRVWNAENVPSGVYYYRLTSGRKASVKKMLLLK